MKHLVIIVVLLWLFAVAPFFAVIGTIAYVYWVSRKPSKKPETNPELKSGDLADLTILRMEIDSLLQQGKLTNEQAESHRQQVDNVIAQYLAECAAEPDNRLWQERREKAWSLLEHYSETPLGLPPWKQQETITEPTADERQARVFVKEEQSEPEPILPLHESASDTEVKEDAKTIQDTFIKQEEQLSEQASKSEFVQELREPSSTDPLSAEVSKRQSQTPDLVSESEAPVLSETAPDEFSETDRGSDMHDYAWEPKEPGVLEKMISALSGWHALAAPFLLQNIGWFIGVFLFIAGSVFLVSYSAGYSKNLFAFLTLFIFTLSSLFGGYQLRRKRPELKTSSHVIFILSILLIPLVTTTVINLLINSSSAFLVLISGVLLVVELSAFYYAVTIVSALMDRSLQRRFPLYFFALNASQLLLFALAVWPYWPVAMLAHVIVFMVLSFGIHTFIHDWLQAIFLDRRKIAYFAAGTLIYAALIAFINFTWWTDQDILFPAGYSGFFLMLLCGLLFYVDSHFKQWTEQQAYLSRFSFVVYGLSVLALFIEMPQQSMAVPTLILAIALYAYVVWHYLTLTPLYIFLLCCFWLYGLLILQYFSSNWHFLLSLPGLYALYKSATWALNVRRCRYLAVISYRMLYALLALLVAWSLFHSERGWLGVGNATLACWLLYVSLASAPVWLFRSYLKADRPLPSESYHNLLLTPWFYAIPFMMGLAVFYLPIIPGLPEDVKLGFALIVIAMSWAYSGLRIFRDGNRKTLPALIEMRLNAALLFLLLALLFVMSMPVILQCLSLSWVGVLILVMSLLLRVRWLVYLTMGCWAVTGMLIKAHFFPGPSVGLVEALLALSIWGFLWWLEGPQDAVIEQLELQAEQARAALLPSFRLLWFWPVNVKQDETDA